MGPETPRGQGTPQKARQTPEGKNVSTHAGIHYVLRPPIVQSNGPRNTTRARHTTEGKTDISSHAWTHHVYETSHRTVSTPYNGHRSGGVFCGGSSSRPSSADRLLVLRRIVFSFFFGGLSSRPSADRLLVLLRRIVFVLLRLIGDLPRILLAALLEVGVHSRALDPQPADAAIGGSSHLKGTRPINYLVAIN